MVTLVGKQQEFVDALKELAELDYDAVEAYETAINRLESEAYKISFRNFKQDHERHIQQITDLLKSHDENAPEGPSAKQWLTKGKVVLMEIGGDGAILSAMKSNEIDTNQAYETMNARTDKWEDAVEILAQGLEDERRHKAWLDKQTA